MSRHRKHDRPRWVLIFSLYFLASSFLWFINGLNFSQYQRFFSHLPEYMVALRYFFSVFLRLFGIGVGVGVFLMSDFWRKAGMALAVFNIVTLPLRHPMAVFEKLAGFPKEGTQDFWVMICALAIVYLVDLGFSVAYIIYFKKSNIINIYRRSTADGPSKAT